MARIVQLSLFDDEVEEIKRPSPKGGSQNPIVFHDYESYIAKFANLPKTTDDTYTPPDVYDAVVDYVRSIYDMTDKVILRPFFPGGDYRNAEYPTDGVVIDNPPFSIFSEICRFYSAHNVPFFLFGPGLTIGGIFDVCCAVIVSQQIKFENSAVVKCNFATNLLPDIIAITAPSLDKALKACPSQQGPKPLPKFKYPDVVVSVSDLQTISKGNEPFAVMRKNTRVIRDLDHHPKGLFGNHLLVSQAVGEAKEQAKEQALQVQHIPLSEREKRIVAMLGQE